MDIEARKAEVLRGIKELEDGLTGVWHKAIEEDDFEGAVELLQQWKARAGQFLRANVSEVEARELQKTTRNYPPIRHVGDIDFRIAKYEGLLHTLIKEIHDDPTILPATPPPPAPEPAKTHDGGNVDGYLPTGHPNISYANELYDRVKTLIQNTIPLDGNTARVIIELVDDSIKEFGNTNQERKVELRQWRAEAESALPPSTIEELRKRAEGQVLKTAFPRTRLLRNVLLWTVGAGVIIAVLIAIFNAIPKTGLRRGDNSGNAATTQQAPSESKATGPVNVIEGNRRDDVSTPFPPPSRSVANDNRRVGAADKPIQRATPQPTMASNLNHGPLELPPKPDPSASVLDRFRSPWASQTPSPSPGKPRQFTEPPRRVLRDTRTGKSFTEHSNMLYGRFYDNWNVNPETAYAAAIEFIEVYPNDWYARYVKRYIKEYERQMPKN